MMQSLFLLNVKSKTWSETTNTTKTYDSRVMIVTCIIQLGDIVLLQEKLRTSGACGQHVQKKKEML